MLETLYHCRETVTMLGSGHAPERLFRPLEDVSKSSKIPSPQFELELLELG